MGSSDPRRQHGTAQRREEHLEGENGSPWKDRTYPAWQRGGTLRTRPRRKALKLAAPTRFNAERPDAQAPGWEAPNQVVTPLAADVLRHVGPVESNPSGVEFSRRPSGRTQRLFREWLSRSASFVAPTGFLLGGRAGFSVPGHLPDAPFGTRFGHGA